VIETPIDVPALGQGQVHRVERAIVTEVDRHGVPPSAVGPRNVFQLWT
jgi:hypothetical protein